MYMINSKGIEQGVIRLLDKASIPPDPENANWKEYLAWAEENEPLPWEENYGE